MGAEQLNNNETIENRQENSDANYINNANQNNPDVKQATNNFRFQVDGVLYENTNDLLNRLQHGEKFVQLNNPGTYEYEQDIQKIKDLIQSLDNINVGEKEQIIAALAVNLGLGYNTLLAMAYTEEATPNNYLSEAKEEKILGQYNGSITLDLSRGNGSYTRYYKQDGNIEINNKTITGAVLDFTGSMKKDQLEGMIMAIQKLAQSGTINENTSFNIMYNVPNMQGDEYKISTIKTNQQLTKNIQYGQNGKGLEEALLNLGLITKTNGERHIVDGIDGKGSTPLYDTILKNLMNSNVRNCVVFTDGSSDTANTGTGEEELGNTESWDQMIRLCKEYNKTIKIVVFNNNNYKYITRTQQMKTYFETHGGLNYLSFKEQDSNDLQTLGGQELSNWIQNQLIEDTTIRIIENPTVAEHKIDIKTTIYKGDYMNPKQTKTTPTNKPKELNETINGYVDFDGIGYNINLQEIFKKEIFENNIDLSQYVLSYNIFSENGIDGGLLYNENPIEKGSWIFDLSGSMGVDSSNIDQIKENYAKGDTYYFQGTNGGLKKFDDKTTIGGGTPLFAMLNSFENHEFKDGMINLYTDCDNGDASADIDSKRLNEFLYKKNLTLNIYDASHDYAHEITSQIMKDISTIFGKEERKTRFEGAKAGMFKINGDIKRPEELENDLTNGIINENTNPVLYDYRQKGMLQCFQNFINQLTDKKRKNSGHYGINDKEFKKDFVENYIFNGKDGRGKIKIFNATKFSEKGVIGTGEPKIYPREYTRTIMQLTLKPKKGIYAPTFRKNLKINTPIKNYEDI